MFASMQLCVCVCVCAPVCAKRDATRKPSSFIGKLRVIITASEAGVDCGATPVMTTTTPLVITVNIFNDAESMATCMFHSLHVIMRTHQCKLLARRTSVATTTTTKSRLQSHLRTCRRPSFDRSSLIRPVFLLSWVHLHSQDRTHRSRLEMTYTHTHTRTQMTTHVGGPTQSESFKALILV